MAKKSPLKGVPLEVSLRAAMKALDKQIAREVNTRSPDQLDLQGVRKWEAYSKRIEIITGVILDSVGNGESDLDSVIVLSQSFTKALRFLMEDLGEDGLGKIRSEYCQKTLALLDRDITEGKRVLGDGSPLM